MQDFASKAEISSGTGIFRIGSKKRIASRGKIPHAGSMHITVEPSILYFGTPVVLLSTLNTDGSPNLAPMSSAWWLGWNCMLGLGGKGHTAQNLQREKECVLNLPSVALVDAVNRLARLTGSNPVPPHKQAMGYRHEKDKLGAAGLTSCPSELVKPPRIRECPVQLEAVLEAIHPFGTRPDKAQTAFAFEVRAVRAHVHPSILIADAENHIDPDKWRPLIMSFCHFYGLGERLWPSTLAEIPEEAYRPVPHMAR
jgi:flavin reductase (DIM6/NTAB) family NADH-FMN oxidoreductase RutF